MKLSQNNNEKILVKGSSNYKGSVSFLMPNHALLMNVLLKLSQLSIIASLLFSCSEPTGVETTIATVERFYAEGSVERFTYYPDGSWIQVKMKDSALRKKPYAKTVKKTIENRDIDTYSEFRFKVRILSLEQFERDLFKIEMDNPNLKKVEVTQKTD